MKGPQDRTLARNTLRKAAERLNQPGAWCQNTAARTRTGVRCVSTSETAVQWSMSGAVRLELANLNLSRNHENRVFRIILDSLEAAQPGHDEWQHERGRKRPEIVRALYRAARHAERNST